MNFGNEECGQPSLHSWRKVERAQQYETSLKYLASTKVMLETPDHFHYQIYKFLSSHGGLQKTKKLLVTELVFSFFPKSKVD